MNIFIFVVMLFFVMEFVNRFLSFRLEVLYILLAVLRVIIDFRNIYTINFILEIFSIIFVYLFFRFFILRLSYNLNTQKVKISDLTVGMRPAEGVLEKKEKNKITYEKIKLFHFDYIDFLFQKRKKFIHSISDEGLTKEDVRKIKYMSSNRELLFDKILIYKTTPFAIFLLVGFVITVLLKGNFISL